MCWTIYNYSLLLYADSVKDWWCNGLHTQFTCWRPLIHVLAGCSFWFGVGARFYIWWWILYWIRPDYTFGGGYGFGIGVKVHFSLWDKFILISNLQTTDIRFIPRVAVSISLHAWLIHGIGLCIFPSHPKKQDKIQPLLQSTLRLSIHFESWDVLSWERKWKISG